MIKRHTQQLVPALLIFLFAYTAGNKLTHFSLFRTQLSLYPYMGKWAVAIAMGVPAIEGITVLLLLIPATRLAGLYTSFALLLIFTLYLFLMIATRYDLPCSCGGVIQNMSWQQHIVFNLFCIALTIAGIGLAQPGKGGSRQRGARMRDIVGTG